MNSEYSYELEITLINVQKPNDCGSVQPKMGSYYIFSILYTTLTVKVKQALLGQSLLLILRLLRGHIFKVV